MLNPRSFTSPAQRAAARMFNQLDTFGPTDADLAVILNDAADLIDQRGWQGVTFIDDEGRLDLHAALNLASGRDTHGGHDRRRRANRMPDGTVHRAAKAVQNHLGHDVLAWQRHPATTGAQVAAAMRDTAAGLDKE